MDALGGYALSESPIAGGSNAISVPTDSVTLTAVLEATALFPLNVHSDLRPFIFPVISGADTEWFVGPHWSICLYRSGTPVEAAADTANSDRHAFPIKVDRRGVIPTFYVESNNEYSLEIRNEHGVIKFEWASYTWPNTVEDHISLSPATETTTAESLTTSEP